MRLIIAGGRSYRFLPEDVERLDEINRSGIVTQVVSGGATGADSCGLVWAYCRGIPTHIFLPNWALHGRAAGPMRNAAMATHADAVALFPGGRGTQSMFYEAIKAGIRIFDWRGE